MPNLELDLNILSLQFAFFLNDCKYPDKLSLANSLTSASDGLLDGEPSVLPIPFTEESVPPEVPRISLKSKDETYLCKVASNRIDLFFKETGIPSRTIESVWSDFCDLALKIAAFIAAGPLAKISRLGFVTRSLSRTKEEAPEYIADLYLREDVFERPAEVQLNVLHKLTAGPFQLNRWTKLRNAEMVLKDERQPVIVVETDINTLPSEGQTFSIKDVRKFLDVARETNDPALESIVAPARTS